MKQITANVYTEDQFSVPPRYRGSNPSFVTTSEGIVMIDTPLMPTDVLKWRNEISKRGEVRYIINTDHHMDHTTGNSFFSGTVVSHDRVREFFTAPAQEQKGLKPGQKTMADIRRRVQEHDPEGVALLGKGFEPRPPAITFSDKLTLHVGGHDFELFHLPGHTPSHIGVYVRQEKVFFTGDNFTNGTQPSFNESLPLQWVDSLLKIEALDIDVVVPGHGEVCDKTAIPAFRMFIVQCIDLVRKAIKEGKTREQAASELSFEGLNPGKEGSQAVHPGPEMQRLNVLRLYEQLSK